MVKSLFVILFCISVSLVSHAQFESAIVGVDGLTCSMCQLGVQKSIAKLDFVEKVSVNLNTNIATVTFKRAAKVNISALAKSVKDAGFSVRSLTARFVFNGQKVSGNSFQFENNTYIILRHEKALTGMVDLKFIEKSFSDLKAYKEFKAAIEKSTPDFVIDPLYFVVI